MKIMLKPRDLPTTFLDPEGTNFVTEVPNGSRPRQRRSRAICLAELSIQLVAKASKTLNVIDFQAKKQPFELFPARF